MSKQLVSAYGTLWARNKENIRRLRSAGEHWGVYVLCDGSMPVYIGRGRIARRIAQHERSKSRGQAWDHSSWYAIPDRALEADVEALLLRMLPFYFRILNRQRAKFAAARRVAQGSAVADAIKRPKLAPGRRRK